ncbi:MAG: triose-phosphate isomerase [Bacteroidia bacterium]
MRNKIIAGNWKMHKTFDEAMSLTSEITNMVKDEYNGSAKIILIPPFVYINSVSRMLSGYANMFCGAQNCSNHASGAYTGEVSAAMIKSCGANYVIIGHSERRQYFAEHNDWLAKKIDAALSEALTPIYCVGETLDEREANTHFDVLRKQINEALFHLSNEQMLKIIIAYEPVWAIGTGKTATTQQAQEIHAFIRKLIEEKYGIAIAQNITILYGGSVKPENASELFSAPDIDGALVGGASLQSRSFADIVKAMH